MATTEPQIQPQPNPYHRKIELQSPLDLIYLQSNIARAARAKLDLHFPPSSSQPATHISLDDAPPASPPSQTQSSAGPAAAATTTDPMRQRVEALVDAFLAQTWAGAKAGIQVNGIDARTIPTSTSTSTSNPGEPREGIDYTYTPYDTTLQKRLASLHAELESLTTQVSRLRREAPAAAAGRYGAELRGQLALEESRIPVAEEGEGEGGPGRGLELDARGWRAETRETYERGLVGLRRLGVGEEGTGESQGSGNGNGSLTETVGKVQRARTVAMELE